MRRKNPAKRKKNPTNWPVVYIALAVGAVAALALYASETNPQFRGA